MVKKRKQVGCEYWKRRGDSLVLATIEGEVCAKREEEVKGDFITEMHFYSRN